MILVSQDRSGELKFPSEAVSQFYPFSILQNISGDEYLISDKSGCYFVTFTVIPWIDLSVGKYFQDDNQSITIDGKIISVKERLNYIHDNPVRNGLVVEQWDYV